MEVAHRPPAKKSPTGSSQWPLEPGLDVSLKLRAASESTGDQKVRAARGAGRRGGQQVLAGPSVRHRPAASATLRASLTPGALMTACSSRSILTLRCQGVTEVRVFIKFIHPANV